MFQVLSFTSYLDGPMKNWSAHSGGMCVSCGGACLVFFVCYYCQVLSYQSYLNGPMKMWSNHGNGEYDLLGTCASVAHPASEPA
mmetsp:Transcript_35485/g.52126  ORF Transcript_35485/g.52126 Transcript_35485/m.52126 type:complete len:84 (-) Transcript_35485:369-620(-)